MFVEANHTMCSRLDKANRYRCHTRNAKPLWPCRALAILILSVHGFAHTAAAFNYVAQPGNQVDRLRQPPIITSQQQRQDSNHFTSKIALASSQPAPTQAVEVRGPGTRIGPRSIGHVFENITSATGTVTFANSTNSTTSMLPTATATAPFTLPQPFDTTLGDNFTSTSCPNFITAFLNDTSFIACHPVSLLLQTSRGFFDDTKFGNDTTLALDASCSVSLEDCNAVMSLYANELRLSSKCGNDYNARNPVVEEVFNGLLAYEAVFRTTCLRDNSTSDSSYCFVDAVTNTSSPTNSYVYYLPLGLDPPADWTPTCDSCLQNTMNYFAQFAVNKTQPISKTYMAAAQQINLVCKPGFVNADVSVTSGGTSLKACRLPGSFRAFMLVVVGILILP